MSTSFERSSTLIACPVCEGSGKDPASTVGISQLRRMKDCAASNGTGWATPQTGSLVAHGVDSLDEAWHEAEAALPEGWSGPFVGPHFQGDYWANAWRTAAGRGPSQPMGSDNIIVAELEAHGPTPAAALHALTVKLIAHSSSHDGER